jgi:L-iditol 2-dehydrogenase
LIELPVAMTFGEAALLEPAAVALHAVKRLDLAKIDGAAVVGTGAIGGLIARWLRIFGVTDVVSIGRGETPARQFDACIEAVGSVEALGECIEFTRPNGSLVLVGNPAADFHIDQELYWQILRKQLIVQGSWNSSFPADWQDTIMYAEQLRLSAFVLRRCDFAELRDVVMMMHERKIRGGKVLLNVGSTDSEHF